MAIVPNANRYDVISKFSTAGLIEKTDISAPCESQDTKARAKYQQIAAPMIEKLNKGFRDDFTMRQQRWNEDMKVAVRQKRDLPPLPMQRTLVLVGIEVTPLIAAIWLEDERLVRLLFSNGAKPETNGVLAVVGEGPEKIPLRVVQEGTSKAKVLLGLHGTQ